jgi:hypothetical protein
MREVASTAVSRRAREITPFLVMDILERAKELERQGEQVIHLEIGEPDFPTPEVVKDAAYRAMAAGETQYTHSQGLIELRETLCRHYLEKYGVRLSPEQFIVTSGTSPAMVLIFAALLDPGDEAILSDPHYACYPNFLRLVDAAPLCQGPGGGGLPVPARRAQASSHVPHQGHHHQFPGQPHRHAAHRRAPGPPRRPGALHRFR